MSMMCVARWIFVAFLAMGVATPQAATTVKFKTADGRDYDVDDLLDFSIILKDSNGENVSLPLSTFTRLLPQFKSQFTKLPPWEADRYYPREQIMESFRLPLSAFITENPALNLFYLQTIVFAFDQMDEGRIILDDIGFSLH